jgi:hypothetical protein
MPTMESEHLVQTLIDGRTDGGNGAVKEWVESPPLSVKVPTPTAEYRAHRKLMRAAVGPAAPPIPTPIPIPIPLVRGARALIWKQDPSVGEIGIRKTYLPGIVLTGPKDGRITIQGLPPVSSNALGDFIQTPGTDAFDAVHTFAVVRETLTMYQRALNGTGSPAAQVPWQWNLAGSADALQVFPHDSDMMNAFYSRNQKALKFGFFHRPGPPPNPVIFTCRSFDIVAHETGHAVLDGLKPNWILASNPPQTGGLHESFGDLTAIFLALSQLDQVEAVIAQTRANLHDKTFLADLAEEFGLALGRPNGLRNADNDFKLSQVGNEVHAISQVFTGAIYDILADIFASERNPGKKDDAIVLYEAGQYLLGLLLHAIKDAPPTAATYANVVNKMLSIASTDGSPAKYRTFIRNRFTFREVVVSPVPLAKDDRKHVELAAGVQDAKGVPQNRSSCCGTMQNPEFNGAETALEEEIAAFLKAVASADGSAN